MNKTNTNRTNRICSMLRLTSAVALAIPLVACEDLPQPTPKQRPSVSEALPSAEPKPTPPPVTPPPTVMEPEVVKATPVVVDLEEEIKHLDTLSAARKLLTAGEVDRGLELAKLAVRQTPKRSAAWNTLGRAQLRAGKRKDSIASFEQAVDLNPSNSYARNNLGLALIYDKQYEAAVDALEEAVELAPVEPYMWNNLGMAYEQLDRLDDARNAYGKAVAMESDRARESLTRLKGVESVIRTAKAEPDKTVVPGTPTDDTGKTEGKSDKETPTVQQ
jgi:tetratricopeptide (TPR) repeat protein